MKLHFYILHTQIKSDDFTHKIKFGNVKNPIVEVFDKYELEIEPCHDADNPNRKNLLSVFISEADSRQHPVLYDYTDIQPVSTGTIY